MNLRNWFSRFWKKQSNQSDQLIKDKSLWVEKESTPLNVEYKLHVNASECTDNQQLIDSIVEKIIEHDYSKRQYAGRESKDLLEDQQSIYQYESYRTQEVKLVPNDQNHLDIYVEDTLLGELPHEYTQEAFHYLQSTVVMAFAYVKGGPYKYFDKETDEVKNGKEPFDLNLYIQFS